ncbi:hypothetical protein [Extensimonas vulgaris]|uniref:Uncharacterized protein n=1 Tax=Extensimonas vulgaris TaxID=1031594 RepID=A0A369ANE5_9BURK|nr:hypothetical protein [Extensimonas vulgaris]RCX10691.1 hypothetical protein DFR45_10292 [Extensimonas vulgaris]TWI41333.1 hypothetical protein IP95_00090 [Extensimonas vulgaris]TXD16802.1 hypothetical protein FUT63_02085 [Extensimonas vulgaris]
MNNPTDIAQSEIDDLIRSEQDPRNRAMLLVLAKIASTLTDNTRLTREIGDRLEDHLTSYERKAASDADTAGPATIRLATTQLYAGGSVRLASGVLG